MEEERLTEDSAEQTKADARNEQLEAHVSDLTAPDGSRRLRAVIQLQELGAGSGETLKVLERMAARDPSPKVRAAAFSTLTSPEYRDLSRRRTHVPPVTRRLILHEIDRWVEDGVMPFNPADVLRARYS